MEAPEASNSKGAQNVCDPRLHSHCLPSLPSQLPQALPACFACDCRTCSWRCTRETDRSRRSVLADTRHTLALHQTSSRWHRTKTLPKTCCRALQSKTITASSSWPSWSTPTMDRSGKACEAVTLAVDAAWGCPMSPFGRNLMYADSTLTPLSNS
jgi:hypothetical protein